MHYAAAILYGWATAVLGAIALGFIHGLLDRHAAIVALCAGALATLAGAIHARRARAPAQPPRNWEWFPIILFGLFAARAFLWLIFQERDELRVLSPNNLGDMSLHLTYIEYFANGAPFWPDNPIFASGKLAYAAGADIFNSLLALAGLDVIRGLIWVGLAGAILTAMALWQWGRAFALAGFLCAGGLLGFAAFSQPPGEPFFQDYPDQLQFDWAWKSLPLALLVTQRGFLFALPAGLLLLASWRSRFLRDGEGWRLPVLGEVLLYASMPIFHAHTFIALSFVLACWFVCRAAARKKIGAVIAAAFVPATVLLYLTIGMFRANALPDWSDMSQFENPPARPAAQILGWQPGWMVNDPLDKFDPWPLVAAEAPAAEPWEAHGRFALFWLGNFGLLPFFAAAVAWLLLGKIRGARLPVWWALAGGIAFVLVTPLLGQFPSYQRDSLHEWLLGGNVESLTSNLILFAGTVAVTAAAIYAWRRQRLTPLLRGCLWFAAGLLFADGLLATARMSVPAIPLVRANAIPLLAATTLFLVLLTILARRWKPEFQPAALLFPGLYLFFLCFNVMFAPSAWDNTKLMLWAYLLVLPPIWELVIARWNWWMRAVALVALFFSGFVSLIGGLRREPEGFAIASVSELNALREATAQIPITATFAAEPAFNHPLLLIGRKLVLGYAGHLWSHGLLTAEQERRLNSLMHGGQNWRLDAARLGARYLYFGRREAERWPDSRQGWREGAAVVAEGRDWILLDLETPPLPVEP